MRKILLLLSLLISALFGQLRAQNGSTGSWKVHLPFHNPGCLTAERFKVYVGGPNGLFVYNITENSLEIWDKSKGLSSLAISAVKYNTEKQLLMIVYANADIDLVKGSQIINIPDIKRKQIIGEKRINHISFEGRYAYLSGTLGIIVLDLDKEEIKDSYINIGPMGEQIEVNQSCIYHDSLYAATHKGIFRASLNSPNLADFAYWSLFQASNHSKLIATYKDKLIAEADSVMGIYTSTSYSFFRDGLKRRNYDLQISFGHLVAAQQDGMSIFWSDNVPNTFFENSEPVQCIIGSNRQAFYLSFYETGLNMINSYNGSQRTHIYPNGPVGTTGGDIAVSGTDMWVAGGNPKTFTLDFNFNLFYKYSNGQWNSCVTSKCGLDSASDIAAIAVHPFNNKVYLGSFGRGLSELSPSGNFLKAFNESNSTLGRPPNDPRLIMNVSGLKFDNDGNLWVSNFGAVSPLSVMSASGKWTSYNFGSMLNGQYPLTDIELDEYGRKWIVAVRGDGILVFDDNGTLEQKADDQSRLLKQGAGHGGLPNNDIVCVARDLNGEMWIGTQAGLTVFYNAADVFKGADASQIIIGTGNNASYLLGTEYINCITVDAANRKWIGTRHGVWLISADGNKIVRSFNEENSPLISDNVQEIGINPMTGEVLITTDRGIMSYFGDATGATDKHANVFIYPNPVRPGYNGLVSIRGLPEKANVKITDINGFLVYETSANGGMATWNGRNFNGERAATGVYLVFSSNKDGTDTMVNKILFVN